MSVVPPGNAVKDLNKRKHVWFQVAEVVKTFDRRSEGVEILDEFRYKVTS